MTNANDETVLVDTQSRQTAFIAIQFAVSAKTRWHVPRSHPLWCSKSRNRQRYFLKLPAATSTATPSITALGSRIATGCTLTGKAR